MNWTVELDVASVVIFAEEVQVKFSEKQVHPWFTDMTRGDRPCPYVTMSTGDRGYLCCAWKIGHPDTLPHEVVYDQPNPPPALVWILRECAEKLVRKW